MLARQLLLSAALILVSVSGARADAALEDCKVAAVRAEERVELQQAIGACELAKFKANTAQDRGTAIVLIGQLRSRLATIKPKPKLLPDYRMMINPDEKYPTGDGNTYDPDKPPLPRIWQ